MVLRGALRLGMVTTCLPKARDGHHALFSGSVGFGPYRLKTNGPRLEDPTWVMPKAPG